MILFLAIHCPVSALLLASFAAVCISDHRAGKPIPVRDLVLGVTFAATWEVSMLLPMAVVPWFGAVVGMLAKGVRS